MSSPDTTVESGARRPGRPRSTAVAEKILRAAKTLFAERGFSGTSVRDIAALAGTDPAIVIRQFGSKEKLFLEILAFPAQFSAITDGPLATLGRDVLHKLVEADDSTIQLYNTLLGALDRPDVRRYLQESTTRNIVEPLAARLSGRHARLRARLVAAQIGGLLLTICMADEDSPNVRSKAGLDRYARAIQVLIDKD